MANKISIHIITILTLALFFSVVAAVSAEAPSLPFTPQVIKGLGFNDTAITGSSIGNLIVAIYKYAIGIVGILATVVMMFGGFLWLTAGGDSGRLTEAKEWIKSATTGLILALSSFLILATINPQLTTMTEIKLTAVNQMQNSTNQPAQSCCLVPSGTGATKNTSLSQEQCSQVGAWVDCSCAVNGSGATDMSNCCSGWGVKSGAGYICNNPSSNCQGEPDGTKCFDTNQGMMGAKAYCYNQTCISDSIKGKKGEPCGGVPGATCVELRSSVCPYPKSAVSGGRNCDGLSLKCCK